MEVYKQQTGRALVEPAHMELASPSIGMFTRSETLRAVLERRCPAIPPEYDPVIPCSYADDAFDACVSQGATTVIISPFFLSPGRHWQNVRSYPHLLHTSAG